MSSLARNDDAVARVAAALTRLDEAGARTNCVVDRDDEVVLSAVAEANAKSPFRGEPITVKDWIDVSGFRCSGGSAAHIDRRPAEDAPAISRLREAGAVVVAKTAVGVDSEHHGRVLNPHDLSRSPGASSSGEAAAVGGGAVRLGIGSDSGGSIRVPAAWCLVVGMKPSAGLIPLTGHFPEVGDRRDGRTVIGPLAQTVALAWTAVKVMAGPDGQDAAVAPVVLGDPGKVDLAGLRFAIGCPRGAEISRPVEAALERVGEIVESAGAVIVGGPPDWLEEARDITENYWDRTERTGSQVWQDLDDWDRFRRRVLAETAGVDVIVTPTVGETAPLHRPMTTEDYLFCLPASLTGAPALSIPVGESAVQVIAHRWSDHIAVAAAQMIEAALA